MWKTFREITWSDDLKEAVCRKLFIDFEIIYDQKCLVKMIECGYPYIEDVIDAYKENIFLLMDRNSPIHTRYNTLEEFLLKNIHNVIFENEKYLQGQAENDMVILVGDSQQNFETVNRPLTHHLALINKLKCPQLWDDFFKGKLSDVQEIDEKLSKINLPKEECEDLMPKNTPSMDLYRKLTIGNSVLFEKIESYPDVFPSEVDILKDLFRVLFNTEDSILGKMRRRRRGSIIEKEVSKTKSFKKWFDEYSSLNMSISDWFLGGYSTIPDEYLEEALRILNIKTEDDPLEALAKIANIASIVDYCGGQAKSEEEFYKNFNKCVISRVVAGKRLDRFSKKVEKEEVWSDIEE